MTDFLDLFGLRPIEGINLLILLLLVWILFRVINDTGNLIEWADYISTRGTDGKQHGDINKVGQWAGILIAVMSVMMYADNETVDATGLAALLGVALLYLGGVAGYAANLRSRQGTITTVTEPVIDTVPTKTTVTESPPVAAKKGKG